LHLFGGFLWTDTPLASDLQSGRFFALDHASYDSRSYCQQRSGFPDRQQVPRPKIIFLWFHAPNIEQRQCHDNSKCRRPFVGKSSSVAVQPGGTEFDNPGESSSAK